MIGDSMSVRRDQLATLLFGTGMKVVFAESCTAGMCSAMLGQVEGISDHLCGSMVTYRPQMKIDWLKVKEDTIKEHTCESSQVADEMALNVLEKCVDANFSAAIVGDIGRSAEDWIIYVAVACRATPPHDVPIKARVALLADRHIQTLHAHTREERQEQAVDVVYDRLYKVIASKEVEK